MAQLTGSELLAALDKLGPASKADKCRAGGYFTVNAETGAERLNYTAFMEAFMEANGLSLGAVRTGNSSGRGLSYFTRIQKKGALVVGAGYVEQLDFEPGQVFKIEPNAEAGTILLTAVDEDPETDEDEDSEEE